MKPYYQVVRFSPDPEVVEPVNVALFVASDRNSLVYDETFPKLSCVAPKFDRGLLDLYLRHLSTAVEDAGGEGARVISSASSQFSLTGPREILTSNINSFVQTLVERYLARAGSKRGDRAKAQQIQSRLEELAELFDIGVGTVNHHLKEIFAEGELAPEATIRRYRIVRTEGQRSVAREIEHYNLEAILAVGFRVRSQRGTQFRKWATARLSEYLVKGFTMDDERLKNPPGPGHTDYFDELLERIREIRASERRFYQKVLDIYATSIDYQPQRLTRPVMTAPASSAPSPFRYFAAGAGGATGSGARLPFARP